MIVGASNPHVIGFALVNASYGPPTPPDPEQINNGSLIEHRDLPPGNVKTTEQKEFHLSLNYFKDGEQYDPLSALKSCSKPKLLIYGTDDEFTEPQEVQKIFQVIPEPKMLHELHCEHDYRYHADMIEEVNTILGKFIKEFLEGTIQLPSV